MQQVKLHAARLPLVRDVGFIVDEHGSHRHPDRKMDHIHVFIYVQEGCIHVIEQHKEYRVPAGSYLFLRKNTAHWGGDNYEPGTAWYYIHFYDAVADATAVATTHSTVGAAAAEQLEAISEQRHFPHHALIAAETYNIAIAFPKQGKVANMIAVHAKLQDILKTYENPAPLRPTSLSVLTYQLFIELYHEHMASDAQAKSHHIVTQLTTLLRQAKTARLSSSEISTRLGMNYAYLSSVFKQHTGMTIRRFQNELLIEQAIALFRSNYGNVTEVSDALGFSNPYYFSRVFKQITGAAPTVFINEHYKYN